MKDIIEAMQAQQKAMNAMKETIESLGELAKSQNKVIELMQEEIETIKDPKKFPAKSVAYFLTHLFK